MRHLPIRRFIPVVGTERKGGLGYQSAADNSVINCIMYVIPVSERWEEGSGIIRHRHGSTRVLRRLEVVTIGVAGVDMTMLIMHSIDHVGTAAAGSL